MIFPPPPAPCPPVADRRAAGDCDLLLPRDFPPQAGCGLLLLQLTAEKGLRDEPLEFTPREEETVGFFSLSIAAEEEDAEEALLSATVSFFLDLETAWAHLGLGTRAMLNRNDAGDAAAPEGEDPTPTTEGV